MNHCGCRVAINGRFIRAVCSVCSFALFAKFDDFISSHCLLRLFPYTLTHVSNAMTVMKNDFQVNLGAHAVKKTKTAKHYQT